jgi:hypothetical protein
MTMVGFAVVFGGGGGGLGGWGGVGEIRGFKLRALLGRHSTT